MIRSSKSKMRSDMMNSTITTTTLYRHHLNVSDGGGNNRDKMSSSSSNAASASLSEAAAASLSTSILNTGSCIPTCSALSRAIPDGNDKYGSRYKSIYMRLGCYIDNSPRRPGRNATSGSSRKNMESGNTIGSSLFQQRFMIFISLVAFVRISNTFYMYKTSLEQILQGYEPSSSSPSYSTRYLTSMMQKNDMMNIYYHANVPNDKRNGNRPNPKKTHRVMYETLLDQYKIPSLVVPQFDVPKAIQQEGFDPWMLKNDDEMNTRIHTIRDTYREQRQQRTRPPSILTSDDSSVWTVVETFTPSVERTNVGKATTIDVTSGTNIDGKTNWEDLCNQANVSKTSRVIITNALSVSIGAPLTLLLSKQCGVKNIMIVDSMFPNTKRRRAIMMDTYRTLFRNILTIKFTNPTNTVGLAKIGSESATDWMEQFQPSHIIHLEDLDVALDSNTDWGDYMSKTGQQLYHIQNSLLPLQQIMNYVHHKEMTNPLNILHVSLSSILSDPSSTIPTATKDINSVANLHTTSVTNLHTTSVTHDVNVMMADYLYTIQQFRTMHDSNMLKMYHLKLPNVYGPIMNSKLNDRTKTIHGNNDKKSLYLDDAMVGIFKALHLSQNGDRQIMTIPSSFDSETNGNWRQDLTYAYDLDVEHPFGGVEQQHYLSTITSFNRTAYDRAMTLMNDAYGTYKTEFPCASSCIDPTDATRCDASVWDTVYPLSRSITEHCSNIMYYVNLDPKLVTISGPEVVTPATNSGESNAICRLAFVSGGSALVVETLLHGREAKDEKNLDDADALREYNGKLTMNGWTLVWIPDSTATIKVTESDRSLIRIDPSRFFASSVQKAIYVESDDIMTLSNDDVMERILSNTEHEAHPEVYHTTELRDGYEDLFRTIEHPPSNGRSVTFMASELPIATRPNNPAQYIEQLSTRVGVDNVKGRHLNYYKQMNHYIQVDMNRPVEDSDGSSPFIWISRNYFVHNLQSDEGHIFRCQWYDAHMYWGPESIIRDSEELSLAYILAKQRIEGSIGYTLGDDPTWYPQQNKYTGEQINNIDDKETTTEAFIRFMKGEKVEMNVEVDTGSTTAKE